MTKMPTAVALTAWSERTVVGDRGVVEQTRAWLASYTDGVQTQVLSASTANDKRAPHAGRDEYVTPYQVPAFQR